MKDNETNKKRKLKDVIVCKKREYVYGYSGISDVGKFSIEFKDGNISLSAYSYYINSSGYGELNKEEVKRLYLKMKEYFESQEEK